MSFLPNFMKWNEGSEVPEAYFFWSGISALAALVNGQIWTHMGRFKIYPNMYIVLLGPAGNGKTSAMRRAEKIVRSFEDLSLSAQAETPEGLVRFMKDKCVREIILPGADAPQQFTPITCLLSELSNFFNRDAAGMIDVLTGIWDCGGEIFHRRTKGQGEDMLPAPNINLLGCTTPDWITNYLKTDIVGGGFSRRVIFVNEMMTDDEKRVSWPEDTPEGLQARDNCIAYGKVLRELKGEVVYGPGARAWWDKWYQTRTISREPDVRGYHKSKPTLLLKVAMLVAVSEEPRLEIRVKDLEVALALLEATERHLLKVFQGLGRNQLHDLANKAVEFILMSKEILYPDGGTWKAAKMVYRKDLQLFLHRNAAQREIDDILNHLISADLVFKYTGKHPKSQATMEFIGAKSSVRLPDETELAKRGIVAAPNPGPL